MVADDCWLVAPSKKLHSSSLRSGLHRLSRLGFQQIHYRKDILSSDIYFAGSVERRVAELNQAFSSGVPVIFAAKGGYASYELLDRLKPGRSTACLVGHSDISALLAGLWSQGFTGRLIHGPMPSSRYWGRLKTADFLRACLERRPYSVALPRRSEQFSGEVVGGNLRILSHLIGTRHELDTRGKVLVLEDVNETPAALYTMLLQWRALGKFDGIAALLVGKMIDCGDYMPLLAKILDTIEAPVITELPFGHHSAMIPFAYGDIVSSDGEMLTFETKKGNIS